MHCNSRGIHVPSIFTKDPLLRLKKRMRATVDLKVARKKLVKVWVAEAEESGEEILEPLSRREGKGRVGRLPFHLLF